MAREPTGSSSVTLRMVAAHAGVSKSVVSRVLQSSAHVSPASRRAVEEAIRELGYRPNQMARSLSQRRTMTVGVVVNDLRQPWFVHLLEGLTAPIEEAGLHLLIADGRLDREMDDRLVRGFIEMRVDGLVLAGAMPTSAMIVEATSRIPTVVAGSVDITSPDVDIAVQDDIRGAELALDHLHGLGHRRIAHVEGSLGQAFEVRAATYREWMRRHRLARQMQIESCDTSESGGYQAGLRLLAEDDRRPTAVFATNDMTALGLLAAARELGVVVPDELSVIGFDDSYVAALRMVGLTTIDGRAAEVGARAGRLIVQRIAHPAAPQTRIEVPTRLSVRSTTARCPS